MVGAILFAKRGRLRSCWLADGGHGRGDGGSGRARRGVEREGIERKAVSEIPVIGGDGDFRLVKKAADLTLDSFTGHVCAEDSSALLRLPHSASAAAIACRTTWANTLWGTKIRSSVISIW